MERRGSILSRKRHKMVSCNSWKGASSVEVSSIHDHSPKIDGRIKRKQFVSDAPETQPCRFTMC